MCKADDAGAAGSCLDPRDALANEKADHGCKNGLDDSGRDEWQHACGHACGDRAVHEYAEHRRADNIVGNRADNQCEYIRAAECLTVVGAPADDKRHQREGDQKTAGRTDKLVKTAGKVRKHRYADGTEQQINYA